MSAQLSPLEILPCSLADTKRCAQIQYDAMIPGGLFQTLFAQADPVKFQEKMNARFERYVASETDALVMAVRGGEIVGVAHWELPKAKGDADGTSEAGGGQAGREKMSPAAAAFFKELAEYEGSLPQPHYLLNILAVDPACQRTGAGKALLRWGLEKGDAEGVEVYLQSTEAGRPMYESFGFEQCAPNIPADNSFMCLPMRRKLPAAN
ncbi:acetyltransferase GNAT family [Pseudohyphozyma bogoriensis]|nr:acetyltransferase GNAT family [Pseudohyphozyma bogoriensis]